MTTSIRFGAIIGAALALQILAGCTKDARPDPAPRADGQVDQAKRADAGGKARAAADNEKNAETLLRQAEEAERQGNLSEAMNVYERLRAFPEGSRPKDLDRRIEALRQKMATQGGDAGAATQPAQPR